MVFVATQLAGPLTSMQEPLQAQRLGASFREQERLLAALLGSQSTQQQATSPTKVCEVSVSTRLLLQV